MNSNRILEINTIGQLPLWDEIEINEEKKIYGYENIGP